MNNRRRSIEGLFRILGIGLLSSLAACSSRAVAETARDSLDKPEFPRDLVPTDAENLASFDLGWGRQLSFAINRSFPDFAFGEREIEAWRKRGFFFCKLAHADWSSIVDLSGPVKVRRHVKQVVLSNGSRIVRLTGEFLTSTAAALAPGYEGEPESTHEVGTIVVYNDSPSLSEQIASASEATCTRN